MNDTGLFDASALTQCLLAFLGAERSEERTHVVVAAVVPVELTILADEKAVPFELGTIRIVDEQQVQRRSVLARDGGDKLANERRTHR